MQFFSLLLILVVALAGGMLFSCQSAQAAENDSRVPGVLEYARKYGEEKQKAETAQSEGKKTEQHPQVMRKESTNTVPAESELRRRLRQQEVMLEQVRRENRQLRHQREKQTKVAAWEDGQKKELLEKQVEALSAELKQLQMSKKSAVEEQARLKSLLAEMPVATADELNAPVARQDYAAGVMTGRDLLVMQEGQGLLGLKTENRLLLAGLRDALNQRVLLNAQALQEALSAAEVRTRQARERIVFVQKAAGEKYLAVFRKEKGAKQDESGFWYRLDYPGDGGLIRGEDTRVEVVVSEKLTDGSVVEDMDASGRSLVMKLGDYPPLFRRALERMKNHATMTLVAPPDLAYGDEGYPPKVPPGATMVYTLRVESVTPAEKGVPGKEGEDRAAGEKK
ncbi:TPA: FKBP-type peptidyl-prolyl cis-trans isomerase [Salmonella enterica subsp. enterica serovar Chester]|nr:FKBP-type peptidyl-prolyl cis-trans isomerase [Salmonella enterica subsp. enterica serovar Chester]